jgi:hypothetical protein
MNRIELYRTRVGRVAGRGVSGEEGEGYELEKCAQDLILAEIRPVNLILRQHTGFGADHPFLVIGSLTVDDITSSSEPGHIIINK